MGKLWQLLKDSFKSWSDDYAPSMGAALSYYTMFSIGPLLLIVITVAGLFFGADAVRNEVFGQITGLVGDDGARAIQDMLNHVSEPKTGTMASIISVGALLLGATTVFGELQNAMDRIWHAPARNKPSGLWGMLRTRLLTFGLILGLAFLLAVSLLLSAGLAALGKWWGPMFGSWEVVAHIFDALVSFGLLTVIFGMIYKVMPHVEVRWHDVWVGAAVTAVLFTIGKILIGLYLGKSNVASGFGAAGSIALVMVWVYYSAQIFYLGAEFTRVYAHSYGSRKDQPDTATAKEAQDQAAEGTTASAPAGKAPSPAHLPAHVPALAAVAHPAERAGHHSKLSPAAQRAVAERRAAERAFASAPREDIAIRRGRVMVDPVSKGLASKAISIQRRAERARPAAPIALAIASAAGLVVGAVYRVRSMRRSGGGWLHA